MALTKITKLMTVIASLGTKPQDRPLTTEQFKAKFDEEAESIKGTFNTLIDDMLATTNGKGASQIGLEDSATRYTATNVETALAEIAGTGRTTETVKSLADLISTKVNPNAIINGCFRVNQRVKSGTVTLAAGVYGHDRWKAGASGCTYTFAASGGITTLTITAGSLIQVVEGNNLETATYCLSWTGTAQGKIGAGSLSASGVTGAVTGGTNLSIEFSTGTLSNVKLEKGTIQTPFIKRAYPEELILCQRYFETISSGVSATAVSTTDITLSGTYKSNKRIIPSIKTLSTSVRVIRPGVSQYTSTGSTATAGDSVDTQGYAGVSLTGFTGLTAAAMYILANGDVAAIGFDSEI